MAGLSRARNLTGVPCVIEIQIEVSRLSNIYENILEKTAQTCSKNGLNLLTKHKLRLTTSGREITARRILIATGGTPWAPDIPGKEHVITSDDAFHLPRTP